MSYVQFRKDLLPLQCDGCKSNVFGGHMVDYMLYCEPCFKNGYEYVESDEDDQESEVISEESL
jgi:hypothetical protein